MGERSGVSPLATGEAPLPVAAAADAARVCICILNWNGWRDTIECLESVLRSVSPTHQVVVIDNGSTDGSFENLQDWAAGRIAPPQGSAELASFSSPPLPKPLPHRPLTASELELVPDDVPGERLLLVRTSRNLGYAGGLNVGLRYALRSGAFDYVWLLNNDTVVRPEALDRLVEKMRRDPRLGLCGSTLLFYDEPDLVQALGGFRYRTWLGRAAQIGQMSRFADLPRDPEAGVERVMYGVQGASVLVTTGFLREVGLLCEDYFLYFEEQDWAARARRAGFSVGYAARSIVYHKEGRSTGNNSLARHERSRESDFYQIQSRLLFTRKFYRYALPTVYLGLLGVLFNRLRRRQYDRVSMLAGIALRVLFAGTARHPPGQPGLRSEAPGPGPARSASAERS